MTSTTNLDESSLAVTRATGRAVCVLNDLAATTGCLRRGHNGVLSIMASLQTKDFTRACIGVGRPDSKDPREVMQYVLAKQSEDEIRAMAKAYEALLQSILDFGQGDVEAPAAAAPQDEESPTTAQEEEESPAATQEDDPDKATET